MHETTDRMPAISEAEQAKADQLLRALERDENQVEAVADPQPTPKLGRVSLRFAELKLLPDSTHRRLAEKALATFDWNGRDVKVYRATYNDVLDLEDLCGVSPMQPGFSAARSVPLKHVPWVIERATRGGLSAKEIAGGAFAANVRIWAEVQALFFLAGGPSIDLLEVDRSPED